MEGWIWWEWELEGGYGEFWFVGAGGGEEVGGGWEGGGRGGEAVGMEGMDGGMEGWRDEVVRNKGYEYKILVSRLKEEQRKP